jgi:mono/diheme cytochrome c family protein
MHTKNIKLSLVFTLIFSGVLILNTFADNWDIPVDKKEKNSYIKFDAAASKEGQTIYTKNCSSCHGDVGKNNSLKSLKPIPPDMASAKTQSYTDGELFYILNTGRGLMPSFKNVLNETERWKVISYIRSYNNNYVQVLSKTDPTKSNLVKINLVYDSIKSVVNVQVTASEKNGVVTLKDAEIGLFVSRTFGKIQIDKALRTDSEGRATFNFAKDMPGDKLGNLELVVKVNDEVYGEIESKSTLKIGVPTNRPSLTEKRAMWNVMAKAPIWLLSIYTLAVISFIIFLSFLLYKLRIVWMSSNELKK